ncbi:MAG: CUAEP/CCAEP-tail radical SAM (seleno)protein [Acidiferrobacterales bacterium]
MALNASSQAAAPFKVVLINPYELGRQPFGLAQPAAWLRGDDFSVVCLDLALQKLEPGILARAGLVAIYLGMHTATRIALEALPRIRELAPDAHLCAYGLYAPMNAELLRGLGVKAILGGECEPALLQLAQQLRSGGEALAATQSIIHLTKVPFVKPDRTGLPSLSDYAHLQLPDGSTKVVGFAEASRGCKHLCRHCPVVPVYQGRFRVIPVAIVMEDIRQQVDTGAGHISFGDPDFLNGPTHALRIVRALHAEFPDVTYDATIKIQHLIHHRDLLPELKRTGCNFLTSAVESVDDKVLAYLDKNHTRADFRRAVRLLRATGMALAPTFVPFTPWTTLEGYIDLLQHVVDLELVQSVPPVQLSIRLLIPEGSYMLKIPGFRKQVESFDPKLLGYPWKHRDSRVDRLQADIQTWVADAEAQGLPRRQAFERTWHLAHEALGRTPPALPNGDLGPKIPHMSEPWYCCAEPTSQQLQSF